MIVAVDCTEAGGIVFREVPPPTTVKDILHLPPMHFVVEARTLNEAVVLILEARLLAPLDGLVN